LSSNKGQIFTSDFLMAVVIFLFVMLTLQVTQSKMLQEIENQDRFLAYESLISTTDTFLLSPGYPENWDNTTVVTIGFADSSHILNITKIKNFLTLDYSKAKNLLGFGTEDFNLSFVYANNSIFETDGINFTYGKTVSIDEEDIFVVKRSAALDHTRVRMELIVW
jgi:hypothetical protein